MGDPVPGSPQGRVALDRELVDSADGSPTLDRPRSPGTAASIGTRLRLARWCGPTTRASGHRSPRLGPLEHRNRPGIRMGDGRAAPAPARLSAARSPPARPGARRLRYRAFSPGVVPRGQRQEHGVAATLHLAQPPPSSVATQAHRTLGLRVHNPRRGGWGSPPVVRLCTRPGARCGPGDR